MKRLLQYGVFVNQTDKAHYKTALHVACEAQNIDCVQYLLDAGADPNVQAENGRTPLHEGVSMKQCTHAALLSDFVFYNQYLVTSFLVQL